MQAAQHLQTAVQALSRQLQTGSSRNEATEAGEKYDINEHYEQNNVKAQHANCAIVDCVLQVFRKGPHWLVMVPQLQSVPRGRA